jgi:hypothetical protein
MWSLAGCTDTAQTSCDHWRVVLMRHRRHVITGGLYWNGTDFMWSLAGCTDTAQMSCDHWRVVLTRHRLHVITGGFYWHCTDFMWSLAGCTDTAQTSCDHWRVVLTRHRLHVITGGLYWHGTDFGFHTDGEFKRLFPGVTARNVRMKSHFLKDEHCHITKQFYGLIQLNSPQKSSNNM